MYVAMNRFRVKHGFEDAFEGMWRNRESSLKETTGFREFHLLRGASNDEEGFTLFASHTIWESESAFYDWTRSENFRKAHASAGQSEVEYMGPPVFEGFNAVVGA
ncbi:antibiotic biosynthesis monooxygenase family protein [Pararhizobium mangrovi]|uniref:Antibiotic biosynthesis monooxygenase n=1 Tax=Pararhizobium mangrovi TaxID=2590452 RepID=A0A506U2S8_9HYPH|nr:antibiotic biosynthesis monooxygenase [Pararhizobium mangrovi]TPW28663.1 antibiotic biosynthesis monooxygenase [Pararhizobium mangrovi]